MHDNSLGLGSASGNDGELKIASAKSNGIMEDVPSLEDPLEQDEFLAEL